MGLHDAFDQLTHKTLKTTPNELTYSYYLSPSFNTKASSNPSLPVLLICHGFPDNAQMWSRALPKLLALGYPILLPDILGLGQSDKPTLAKLYNYRAQASCLAQILDHEGVKNPIIPIGHDWGSGICQRFYLYHRERCIGLSLLSLAYQVPAHEEFNLRAANEATSQRFRYPGGQWEYWLLFTRPDGPKVIAENLERFYDVMHGNFPSERSNEDPNPVTQQTKRRDIWMREMFCTPTSLPKDGPEEPPENEGMGSSAAYDYLVASGKYKGYTVDLKPYAQSPELKDYLVSRWREETLKGAVQYYNALRYNTNLEDERTLCPETSTDGKDHRKITVPLLYIGCSGDWVCRHDLMSDAKEQGLLDDCDLEEKVVDSGHWVLYEQPDQIADLLVEWLQRKFPIKA